jgi:putative copper export protein
MCPTSGPVHNATLDNDPVLAITLEDFRLFLHVLAATVWVGGQITLAGLVPVLRAAGADVPKSVARQFNRIAWPAFAVLVLTGAWNISANHDQVKNDADYRHTLIAKVVVVLLSGVAAFMHTRARSKVAMAVWGALTALFALGALFLGLVLSNG